MPQSSDLDDSRHGTGTPQLANSICKARFNTMKYAYARKEKHSSGCTNANSDLGDNQLFGFDILNEQEILSKF